MIVGDALAAWLGDEEARAATVQRVQAFAERFKALAPIAELQRAVAAADRNRADSILSAAAAVLERPGGVDACVECAIDAAARDPFFRPALRNASSDILSGLSLYESPLLNLFLAVVSPEALAAKRTFRAGPASIAFTGQRSVYRFMKSGGATISFWKAPRIRSGFSGARSGRCRLVERRPIEDGETLVLDGRSYGFVIDHAVSDIVYVQAITPVGSAPLMAEYDLETREWIGASSTDEASSRTQLMLALLRTMERGDAAPLFAELVRGDHFYARWQAMREFLALDAELALPHLRAMAASDPHPEVRAAAMQTLEAFFGEAAQQEEPACPA